MFWTITGGAIVAVGALVVKAPPAAFDAETTTRTCAPTRASATTSVDEVAPAMLLQGAPASALASQPYARAVGAFVHVPAVAVNVAPSTATPEIAGGTLEAGGNTALSTVTE